MEGIYEQYDLKRLNKFNLLQKLKPAIQRGQFCLRLSDGKVVLPIDAMEHSSPWLFSHLSDRQKCGLWKAILGETLGLLPTGCMSCWKVVVRPRTVEELIQLYEIQSKMCIYPSKCGLEDREYTHLKHPYGGYFYNLTLENGQKCYEDVRALVDEHISPDVEVTLKRGCTELELKYGPSDQWETTRDNGFWIDEKGETHNVVNTEDTRIWEKMVDMYVDIPECKTVQPGIICIDTIERWLMRAWAIGDETVMKFNDGERLMPKMIEYQKENANV